jgi:FAD dependent oxidoreductase
LIAAVLHTRADIHQAVVALRSLGGPWQALRLFATNEQIGIREGRRIHGRYTVSADDLARGARHDDSICRVHFGVDVHSPKKEEGTAISRSKVRARPYDIPLRALIARDVDGFLMAGRCISGDFIAHSSYRVTGCAVATGQAAGVAAALAAQTNSIPHQTPWDQVKAALSRFGDGPH